MMAACSAVNSAALTDATWVVEKDASLAVMMAVHWAVCWAA